MIANQYEQIGEEIITTCVQPFHQFNGEFGNKRKDLRSEYAKNLKHLDECAKEMDKSKENWSSKFKNSEKAKQQYDKVSFRTKNISHKGFYVKWDWIIFTTFLVIVRLEN